MKSDGYLGICLEQASLSPLRFRHGCIVVKGGKVIGKGFNDFRAGYDGGALKTGRLRASAGDDHKGSSSSPASSSWLDAARQVNSALSMHSEMMAINSALSSSCVVLNENGCSSAAPSPRTPTTSSLTGSAAGPAARTVRGRSPPAVPLVLGEPRGVLNRAPANRAVSKEKTEKDSSQHQQHHHHHQHPQQQQQQQQHHLHPHGHSHGSKRLSKKQTSQGLPVTRRGRSPTATVHAGDGELRASGSESAFPSRSPSPVSTTHKSRKPTDPKSIAQSQAGGRVQAKKDHVLVPTGRSGQAPQSSYHELKDRRKHLKLVGADLYVVRLAVGDHQIPGVKGAAATKSSSDSAGADAHCFSEPATCCWPLPPVNLTGSLHDELIHKQTSPRSRRSSGDGGVSSVPSSPSFAGTKAVTVKLPRFSSQRQQRQQPPRATESRPCYRCVSYMHSVGIKRVFWTNAEGRWEHAKVRDLAEGLGAGLESGCGSSSGAGTVYVTKYEVLKMKRLQGVLL